MARRPKDIRSRIVGSLLPKRRKKSRTLTQSVKAARKKLRHALAVLKKGGLFGSSVSARKNVTSKAVKAAIKRNQDIIDKKRVAWKLPEDIPEQILRDLKDRGYRVEGKGANRRLVLPKSQRLARTKLKDRPIKIMTKSRASRKSAEIMAIKLGPNVEEQIKTVFNSLGKNDYVGFSVDGNNSYSIYANAQSLFSDLSQYAIYKDRRITNLTIFRVSDTNEYLQDGQIRRVERLDKKRAYNRTMVARKRALKKGMRVVR